MKTIKEMISVMTAYADGKEIQSMSRRNRVWEITPNPVWDWCKFDYRIKRKKKKLYQWAVKFDHDSNWLILDGLYETIEELVDNHGDVVDYRRLNYIMEE